MHFIRQLHLYQVIVFKHRALTIMTLKVKPVEMIAWK